MSWSLSQAAELFDKYTGSAGAVMSTPGSWDESKLLSWIKLTCPVVTLDTGPSQGPMWEDNKAVNIMNILRGRLTRLQGPDLIKSILFLLYFTWMLFEWGRDFVTLMLKQRISDLKLNVLILSSSSIWRPTAPQKKNWRFKIEEQINNSGCFGQFSSKCLVDRRELVSRPIRRSICPPKRCIEDGEILKSRQRSRWRSSGRMFLSPMRTVPRSLVWCTPPSTSRMLAT